MWRQVVEATGVVNEVERGVRDLLPQKVSIQIADRYLTRALPGSCKG